MYQNMKGKANPCIGQILGHNLARFRCRSLFWLLKSGTICLISRISFINSIWGRELQCRSLACCVSLFVHPLVDHPVSCRLQAVILWMSSLALECHGSWPPSIGICRQDGHEFASQTKVPYQHVSNIISATLAEAGTMPPQGTTFAVTSQGMSFSVLVWEPVQLELTVRFLKVLFVYHVSNRGEVFFSYIFRFSFPRRTCGRMNLQGTPYS